MCRESLVVFAGSQYPVLLGHDPQTHVLLGRVALRAKDWAKAREHYERATWEAVDWIGERIAHEGIDCGFARAGELDVAVDPHQVDALAEVADLGRSLGQRLELLDREAARARIDSLETRR